MTDLATLSHRIIDEVWNKKNIDAADELISSDFMVRDPNSVHQGLDGYKQFVREYLSAFPTFTSPSKTRLRMSTPWPRDGPPLAHTRANSREFRLQAGA